MQTPLLLDTEREDVVLRQLATLEDDIAYYEAIEASRDHLMPFEAETSEKYPNLEAVTEARVNPTDPSKLRMGIWRGDTFVGSANFVPRGIEAEIGYWLHVDHTGNGYATLAAKALAQYGTEKSFSIFAKVDEGNTASERVLERAGFTKTAQTAGKLTFDLIKTE